MSELWKDNSRRLHCMLWVWDEAGKREEEGRSTHPLPKGPQMGILRPRQEDGSAGGL